MSFVLASASPRRRELLLAAGFSFEVRPVDVDERPRPDELPEAYVERVAQLKARAGVGEHAGRLILAADTIVVVDGEILGKPADEADAARMLRRLSDRAHQVLTAIAVARDEQILSRVERTTVWMGRLTEAELDWYVASGEPMGKAGGYAIQGRASRFIPRIDGSYGNVVGLPVAAVLQLLEEFG